MPYTYVNFNFRYVDARNEVSYIFPRPGKVDEEGVLLDSDLILFQDIYQVWQHSDKVAITLYPYTALSGDVGKYILADKTTVVISVEDEEAKEVKSLINQHITAQRVYKIKQEMIAQGKGEQFRAAQCPDCRAIMDLSYYKPTHYIYCPYSETIFDKLGQAIPQPNNYRICPQCNYFGRIQSYPELNVYATRKESDFSYRDHYCCDTCAERIFENNVRKNFRLLLGLPVSLYLGYKYKSGRYPLFDELTKANRYAQDGKIEKAQMLYSIMALHNERHPGLHYNQGLAYLKVGDNEKALKYFRKSLDGCSNYQPTLDILKLYGDKEVVIG